MIGLERMVCEEQVSNSRLMLLQHPKQTLPLFQNFFPNCILTKPHQYGII